MEEEEESKVYIRMCVCVCVCTSVCAQGLKRKEKERGETIRRKINKRNDVEMRRQNRERAMNQSLPCSQNQQLMGIKLNVLHRPRMSSMQWQRIVR